MSGWNSNSSIFHAKEWVLHTEGTYAATLQKPKIKEIFFLFHRRPFLLEQTVAMHCTNLCFLHLDAWLYNLMSYASLFLLIFIFLFLKTIIQKIFLLQAGRNVRDLFEDLRDGHNLLSLLEVLSGEILVRIEREKYLDFF